MSNTDIQAKPSLHELKTWSEHFEKVLSGLKTFEIRRNDRDFKVGDILLLKEGDLGGNGMTDYDLTFIYTGRELKVKVTHILNGGEFGLQEGYCIMSIKPTTEPDKREAIENILLSEATERTMLGGVFYNKTDLEKLINRLAGDSSKGGDLESDVRQDSIDNCDAVRSSSSNSNHQ